jgi:DNA-binding winged helix-turn-helix (wHTH) protein
MHDKSSIFRFADVEVREREFCLVKSGELIPVEPKAFRVLLILLRNPQKLITKDELLQAVWGNTAVTENSLARSIGLLRRLLGDETRDPRYIETIATVGYRFLCRVDVSEDASGKQDRTSEQAAQGDLPGSAHIPTRERTDVRTDRRRRFIVRSSAAIAAIAGLFLLSLTIWNMPPRLPVVSDIVRLTSDHNSKIPINGVVTDELHLYFMEEQMAGAGSSIAQVSVSGGETTWIPTSLKNALAILDISPDKSKLLLVAGVGGNDDSDEFWIQPLPAGTPATCGKPEGFHCGVDARWVSLHLLLSEQNRNRERRRKQSQDACGSPRFGGVAPLFAGWPADSIFSFAEFAKFQFAMGNESRRHKSSPAVAELEGVARPVLRTVVSGRRLLLLPYRVVLPGWRRALAGHLGDAGTPFPVQPHHYAHPSDDRTTAFRRSHAQQRRKEGFRRRR